METAEERKKRLAEEIKSGLCGDLLLTLETAEKVDGCLYGPSVNLPITMEPYNGPPHQVRYSKGFYYFSGILCIPIQGEIDLLTILSKADTKELEKYHQWYSKGDAFIVDGVKTATIEESYRRPNNIRLCIESENEIEFSTKFAKLANLANYIYRELESSGNIKDYN